MLGPPAVRASCRLALQSSRACGSGSTQPPPHQPHHHHHHQVVFLLGKPGSGKGTQGDRVVARLGYRHLSAGALLRAELQRLGGGGGGGSAVGDDIAARMLAGRIVPSEVTCRLLLAAMAEGRAEEEEEEAGVQQSAGRRFLVDGFPRNRDNLDGWRRCSRGVADTLGVVLIDAPDDVCARRCLGRAGGRSDDNAETLSKRLRSFELDTRPVLEHFERLGWLHRVDGSGEPEAVFQRVLKVFARFR